MVLDFIHELDGGSIPDAVQQRATVLLRDLIGVACAGSGTRLARIARDHAAGCFGAGSDGSARLLLDGRRCSLLGAAWAGAALIDSYDAHDGHALTKGHAGVVLLPALLALADSAPAMTGREFMVSLVLGYEIATRAGIALHASAGDYHCSGAWNALGVAAIASRVLRLDTAQTGHAVGIADYHGPRGLMERGVDHPTMLKDGAGPGAMAGLQSALLARAGYTGAPAGLLAGPFWNDLGTRWTLMEQYVKPYPVCRWAQPAIEAARALQTRHRFSADDISDIEVRTFHEATRLDHPAPADTEQAQYSLPFPLAAMLVHGDLGARRIDGSGLSDQSVLALARRVRLERDERFDAMFPGRRCAELTVRLHSGATWTSQVHEPRGEPHAPLSDAELLAKYEGLAGPVLGDVHSKALAEGLAALWHEDTSSINGLLDLLLLPPDAKAGREET